MEPRVLQGLLVCAFSLLKSLCFGFSFSLTWVEGRCSVRRGVVRENGPGEDLGDRGEKWGVWAWEGLWCLLNRAGCLRVSVWEQRVSVWEQMEWEPRRCFVERSTSKLNMNCIEGVCVRVCLSTSRFQGIAVLRLLP